MIIACARGALPGRLYTYKRRTYVLAFVSSRSERRASRARRAALCRARYAPMPELCLSYAPVPRRVPRRPSPSGQRSAHPLPSRPRRRSPSPRALLALTLRAASRSLVVLLSLRHPCPTRPRRRRRVSVGVGDRLARDRDASLRRPFLRDRPTGSNDALARPFLLVLLVLSLASEELRSS